MSGAPMESQKRIIFRSGYFVSPARRGFRTYPIATCWKPTQLTRPRRNRLCSPSRFSSSATRRSIRRKSPVLCGMGMPASRLSMR